MKWKAEGQDDADKIKAKLIAAGLDPGQVKSALNQEEDKSKVQFV